MNRNKIGHLITIIGFIIIIIIGITNSMGPMSIIWFRVMIILGPSLIFIGVFLSKSKKR